MKQVLLTGAAMLMSVSLAALAETTPAQTNGAAMSPPASTAPGAHPAAHPVDQSASTPVTSKSSAGMASTDHRAPAAASASAPMSTANANASMGTEGMFANIPPQEELSSKVVGLEVYNSANKDLGKIKDIAFDQSGVKAYIVSVGGFLGMGDHYVAVNPSAVNISYDSQAKKWRAAMNTDVDQLKAAPEYKYSSND